MKITLRLAGLLSVLCLTGCGALGNSAGNLLKMPLNLLNGMTKAVGRTAGLVSQNDADALQDSPADVESRGRQVESRGDYSGFASQQRGDVSIGKTAAR
jgi:hypothetical protein